MKKAMLAVSFGTACPEAAREGILPVEQALREAFAEYEVIGAYASQAVLSRMPAREGRPQSVREALSVLRAQGREPVVAALYITPGAEYARLCAMAGVPVSEPLLSPREHRRSSRMKGFSFTKRLPPSEEDLDWAAALLADAARRENCAVLAMGHGGADDIWLRLRARLGADTALFCLHGACTLEDALSRLPRDGREILLLPMMLTAGAHARAALSADSPVRAALSAAGFDARVRMQGLGALEEVQRRFIQKAAEIL